MTDTDKIHRWLTQEELDAMLRDAYKRGAVAMREAAAKELNRLLTQKKATAIWVGPDEIRALPVPKDKP